MIRPNDKSLHTPTCCLLMTAMAMHNRRDADLCMLDCIGPCVLSHRSSYINTMIYQCNDVYSMNHLDTFFISVDLKMFFFVIVDILSIWFVHSVVSYIFILMLDGQVNDALFRHKFLLKSFFKYDITAISIVADIYSFKDDKLDACHP